MLGKDIGTLSKGYRQRVGLAQAILHDPDVLILDVSGMGRYGILLYTGSPDSGGTLGGLVQQARGIEEHLDHALRTAMLCSNDPICAQHTADDSLEGRWLLGAACHGCALVGESSCEMRNDYLDRALVVPVLGLDAAAFFTNAL